MPFNSLLLKKPMNSGEMKMSQINYMILITENAATVRESVIVKEKWM